jgi:hypothetical protein
MTIRVRISAFCTSMICVVLLSTLPMGCGDVSSTEPKAALPTAEEKSKLEAVGKTAPSEK